MAHINFVIPQNKNELLSEGDEQYCVKNVVCVKEIQPKLREAKQCLKDEGAEFIIENFDTYYSILHHSESLKPDHITSGFEDLHKGVKELNKGIGFLLESEDSLDEELKMKYANVIKMLLYVYVNTATFIQQSIDTKRSETLQQKGRNRKPNVQDENFAEFDKKDVIIALSNIMQRDINTFWDPPVVEEALVNIVGEICYRFLESQSIKAEKETRIELFNLLGVLIKKYNHSVTLVVRLVQLIKVYEHVVPCVAEGIEILITTFNCKSLVSDFVREITEWQTDETFQDLKGSKNCSTVLLEMANLMPDLMIPEVKYLNNYLSHDSHVLRNAVLGIITEVVLNVLTKDKLNEEERESRDEFLEILQEHIYDSSSQVRTKVLQHWSKLQEENAIPQKIQNQILEKAVFLLRDKFSNVRKSACTCVTTFLSHNIYGAQLQLNVMEFELNEKKNALENLRATFETNQLKKINEMDEQWKTKEPQIITAIEKNLQGNSEIQLECPLSKRDLPEVVRIYILEDKFDEAFEMCRFAGSYYPHWMAARASVTPEKEVELFVSLMRTIFMDLTCTNNENDENVPVENDLDKLSTLQTTVEFLESAVEFLKLIDSAMTPMIDLLESASVGDMKEAVNFFIASYQFKINDAWMGVLEMLKIMGRNEEERKNHVTHAFKTIYLTTDSSSMQEHSTTIVNRLISLVKILPFDNIQDFQQIISQLVSDNSLDNSIVDMLWQYFLKKVEITDDESRAALFLLMLASTGRKTIVSKNMKLVANVAFGERGLNDPLLVTTACQLLTTGGQVKQDIADPNPPSKIKSDDPLWKNLEDIIVHNLFKKSQYYNMMVSAALEFIYAVCSRPDKICECLIEKIVNSMKLEVEKNKNELPGYVIAQCAHLIGKVAVEILNFLDDLVYKELKRRNYIREQRKANKNNKKAKTPRTVRNASSRKTSSVNNTMQNETNDSTINDESTLEGAQADDTDSEFILNVLENNILNESTGLGQFANLFVNVLERPDLYQDLYIQSSSVTCLMRCMMVSSKFCKKHIQLIFTILEKTSYVDVKRNILIQCSDLLERFPNIVEPWSSKLYNRLKDDCTEVRISAFFMLANLILRDMIRVQNRMSEMASCIVDADNNLQNMGKDFFVQLSRKANNLYNILPDIFSHLLEETALSEENLRYIMKYLFGLIDKNKQMENLVERFCTKFRLTEDEYKCRNIAYCLSLINYNERGARRLLENFDNYRNILVNDDFYAIFKQILNTCNKSTSNEMKEIMAEFEKLITEVFNINEDENPNASRRRNEANKKKPVFKKPQQRAPRKKQKVVSENESSDSDDGEKENDKTPTRKSSRSRKTTRKPTIDDDSD